MIKVSDYIVNRLVEYGIKDVFMISGGGAMHLNDSVGKRPEIKYICNHHEQASAIGAEGYARVKDQLAVVVVTTGPGGTNTLTGVIGQWLDSVPVLYISGQVKYQTTIASCPELGLRQLGDQEINIVDIVKPVTKFAEIVRNPNDIGWLLDKAIHIATQGRPGPVWLDVPLDIQGAFIDETLLLKYDKTTDHLQFDDAKLDEQITQTIELLQQAKRPLIIAGNGIRLAHAQQKFYEFIEKMQIPVVTSFNGFDLLPSDHALYVGRPGTIGTRSGNFAVQNADVILCIGSRNNIRQISYNWTDFARNAKKIIVDIDGAELNKPTIKPDLGIHADAGEFLSKLLTGVQDRRVPDWQEWQKWCIERREKYPIVLEEYKNDEFVQPYYFMKVLSDYLPQDACVVTGNGTASVAYFQAGVVKEGQRVFWNSGCASMGYDLPAAIGACLARDKKDVVCLAGDGSLQMNLQELQTVVNFSLPVKIFVLNNSGYSSIRQTQDNLFEGRRVACDAGSGVSFPDITKVAAAYGLKTYVIKDQENLAEKVQEVMETSGPIVCEVILSTNYIFVPKVSSKKEADGRIVSAPLEDMYPFLEREELEENYIVKRDDC